MSKVLLLLVIILVSSGAAFASSLSSESSLEIVSLLDVQGQADTQLLLGLDDSQVSELVPSGKLNSQILAFFVRTGEHNILFDAGLRDGHVVQRLAENGIMPEDVKVIMITHLHPDHFGGLVDENGHGAFPSAELYVARIERDYWVDVVKNESVINALNLYEKRVHLFEFGDEVLHGVKALDASGHTPGHTAFEVNHEALIVGDIMHFPEVQLRKPEVSVRYDVDPDKAREARIRILDYAADKKLTVAGMHITTPGVYKLKKTGTGYELE